MASRLFGHGEIIIFTLVALTLSMPLMFVKGVETWLLLLLSQFWPPQLLDIYIQGNCVLLFARLSDSFVYANNNHNNNVVIFFIIVVILASRTLLMPLQPTIEFINGVAPYHLHDRAS